MWTVLWHSRHGPNDSAAGERSLAVLSHHTCTENSAWFSCELAARGHRRPDVTPRPPPREMAIVGERQSARHKGPYSFRAHRPPSLAGTGEPGPRTQEGRRDPGRPGPAEPGGARVGDRRKLILFCT